ncbi:MAG: GHKL domain-containing protein [Sedimentibacter sp.]|uniref:sensor histidine kinase n=1 Tax=Sedimentibacter sp. TaxID=1960295 RepID=UPI0029827445|nr:GHKL domain-containing protein [Sedimentibacter sp.]MDW5299242.1 GHKL domain-containing protein [Sedimentibacter sp.]
MTNSVTIVYLITNAFCTYTMFRFMGVFFGREETDKKIEFASYMLYYFVICLFYLAYNKPVLNILSNLIMFFLLTYNYKSTIKTRLIATVSVYTILMIIETVVILSLNYFNISIISQNSDIEIIAALIIMRIISYIIVLFLSNFKMVKNNMNVSFLHWLSIFVIPFGTLISALMLIAKVHADNLTGIIISIVILFVINIFVFYLYDELMRSYDEKVERVLLLEQNNAYLKQLDIINQSQENLKVLRHDIKNHVLSLQSLIENDDNEGAVEYLKILVNNTNYSDEYSKSGNPEIDSILNYKINKANIFGIKTDINLNVPEKLNIRPFDLSVILGNLMDNAIEAASKSKDEKQINVSVDFDRNVLYINISNSFDGILNYKNGKLSTTNMDKENHGLGLSSIRKSVDMYNGTMEIHHNKKKFYVDVLIYNNSLA